MSKKSARHTSILLPSAAVLAGMFGFVLIGGAVTNAFSDGKVLGVQIAKGDEESGKSERSGRRENVEKKESRSGKTESEVKKLEKSPSPENNEIRAKNETTANETRSEVRLSESERIRVRTKDGATRVDVTSGDVKTKLEYQDDKVVVKTEDERGEEVELEDSALREVTERLDENRVKVTPTKDEKFVLQRGSTAATTKFPLSVDLATNQLTVETPSGQSKIVVLPDQAILNLLTNNVISKIDSESTNGEGMDSTTKQAITLNEEDGVPVYEVKGVSEQHLFWLIPVKIKKNVKVSTDTGEVVGEDASFLDRVTDLLSK